MHCVSFIKKCFELSRVKYYSNQVEKFRLIGSEKYKAKKGKYSLEIGDYYTHTALYEIIAFPNLRKDKELLKVKLN